MKAGDWDRKPAFLKKENESNTININLRSCSCRFIRRCYLLDYKKQQEMMTPEILAAIYGSLTILAMVVGALLISKQK